MNLLWPVGAEAMHLPVRDVEDDGALGVLLHVAGVDHLADQARRGLAVDGLLLEVVDLRAEGDEFLELLMRGRLLPDRLLLLLRDLLLAAPALAADLQHVGRDALGD